MIVILIAIIGIIVYFWRFKDSIGKSNIGYLATIGLIFTASLDLGIIMLPPITDMSVLGEEYGVNHHAFEISLWAGVIWLFYLAGIFYYKYIEDKYHFLEFKLSKILFCIATFLTYAFSIQLFKDTLPSYTDIRTEIFIVASLVVAIIMYSLPKFKLVLSKLLIPAILFLPLWAVISGATFDTDVLSTLPKAQIEVWNHMENPDVDFFVWWWIIWSLPTARYLYNSCQKTSVSKLGIMVIIVPLLLVIPWISVDMSLDFIKMNQGLFWYMIILAVLFLSSSIVAMMYSTNEVFELLSVKSNRVKSYLSCVALIGVTAFIYLVHLPLGFIASIYGISILTGIILYGIKRYRIRNNKSGESI
jgi:hypothetical protein